MKVTEEYIYWIQDTKFYAYILQNKFHNKYNSKLGTEQDGFIIYIYNETKVV